MDEGADIVIYFNYYMFGMMSACIHVYSYSLRGMFKLESFKSIYINFLFLLTLQY